jgi:hypothetical protein
MEVFQSSQRSAHLLFLPDFMNRGRKSTRSDSYISATCGCLFSRAYISDEPARHMLTTKRGPDASVEGIAFVAIAGLFH